MDWRAIEAEYITTETSLRCLAEKRQLSLNTLRDNSVKRGWVAKRREYEHKTTTEILQKTSVAKVDAAVECADMMRKAATLLCKSLLRVTEKFSESPNVKDLLIICKAMSLQLDNNEKLFATGQERRIIVEMGVMAQRFGR